MTSNLLAVSISWHNGVALISRTTVAALRKALGDSRRSPAYIETVSRSGYRFVAMVRHEATADTATPERSAWFDRECSFERRIELVEHFSRDSP